jgi:uncharacterized protein
VTLCDAGPLVALIVESDPHHDRCLVTAQALPPEPLVTTWPCWAEAMYLVGRAGGFPAQQRLWRLRREGTLRLHLPGETEEQRMEALMLRYQDSPMDLGDASLVAAAETLGLRRVFTLDRHFLFYRINDTDTFEVVP